MIDTNQNSFTYIEYIKLPAIQSKGDPTTTLHENLTAEQQARSTCEYLIQLSDDRVIETLQFLREREIVHYQRFRENLGHLYDYYGYNHYFYRDR